MQAELHACRQFLPAEAALEIHPYGSGLINDTYLVTRNGSTPQHFVLQRINTTVFALPQQIAHNQCVLSEHIAAITTHCVALQLPPLLKTATGKTLYTDPQGHVWRLLGFIADSITLDTLADAGEARQIGFALGHFHRLAHDLDANNLYDTLPGFHHTPAYWQQYQQTLTSSQRPPNCAASEFCVDFLAARAELADTLESAKRQGALKERVIHGDPKLDNFLFHRQTRKVISLIDLDTVKPGLIHYDIGDCLRSCCRQNEPAHFDLALGAAILHGYLQEARHFMTAADYEYLFPAIQLLPFELGLRFFTDYLNGNQYFKVSDARENLRRAVDQFELLQSIEAQQESIQALLRTLRHQYRH